jgi:drug/metabolite transporter (DMT)-like permease
VTALGLLIALAAAVANAFAVVLQAGEDRQAPLSQGARLSLFVGLVRRPRWVAGTSLMVLAWPLQILALTLAPITVVQPTLSATQLVLLGVARVKLGERVGRLEIAGALAIVVGVATVVWAAPHHSSGVPGTARVAPPLVVVGLGALAAYVIGRRRPRLPLAFVIGAGLAYAWVDFANKLLANDLSLSRWGLAAVWLAATVLMGALAFLQETTALQRRPAVTVAPVVGAVQDPLPVVMALWAGVETWGAGSQRIVPLICGLAVSTAGAAILGRSRAVARAAGEQRVSPMHRPRLAACAPTREASPGESRA